jgi:hypothetical protein
VLAARLRVLGADHPDTHITRHNLAWEMSEQRNHAGAQAEFRDVLAAKLRVRDLITRRPSATGTVPPP